MKTAISSSIGLLSVFADLAILLALAMALASPRITQLARAAMATLALACAWLMTATAEATRAPGWTVLLGAAVILVSIVVVTIALHLWADRGDGGESGPGPPGAHGGGGPRHGRPDAPQDGGGDSEASWWPEFELQLALYAAERSTVEAAPVGAPADYSYGA